MKNIKNSIIVIYINILYSCIPASMSEEKYDSNEIRKTLLIVADLASQNNYELISRDHCCNSITIIPTLDQDEILTLSNQNEKISYLKKYFTEGKLIISENNHDIYISNPIKELNKEFTKSDHKNLALDNSTFRWQDIVFKKEKNKYLIYQIYSDTIPARK
jgi:hypothetical protein